ncbi:putative glutamate carboxypeptidase protein [Neofusicoccum parvum]|uniref:Putative glutamate carboxypeptidase protein n=1 Tax=Botryosphaeria parva (strain UCR-NP2) TaxID=1287680 RepID=R1EM72_BOTPV|nr:putative glutamate carboxypeptidase protein [Neofusicoccum parvum UCRNP2]GME64765.1 putative glutamate carboxypeptidase protein [Neofusicoccum parvum]
MVDEKHPYDPKESLPIPTYEEATSSRPSSVLSHLGPNEVSDDAERQGLLGPRRRSQSGAGGSRRADGYQQPSVESVRDSMESDLSLPDMVGDSDDEETGLQREMEQLEVIEAGGQPHGSRRARIGMSFSKRISSIGATLSSMRLPRLRKPLRWPTFSCSIPSIPEHMRPGYSVILRLFGVLMMASLVYALLVTSVFPLGHGGMAPFNPEWARSFVQSQISADRIRENLKHITSIDHVAGTKGDKFLANWIESFFKQAGMDKVATLEYNVYLNYPTKEGRRVAIVDPPEFRYEAKLEEELAVPGTRPEQQTMVFHGLSRSGNVTAPLVYANYGSQEDFKTLRDRGIDVNGTVVLVRYYGSMSDRAMKVKFAEENGAVGCLIYSDPKDDGFVRGDVYPDGRWRPEDGVSRGSVAQSAWIVGDVLTPGIGSVMEADRISKDNNPALPNIPSMPLAWRDAKPLLQALKGHGDKVPKEWVGGIPEVDWWTGDSTSPLVLLQNEQDEEEKQPIWNVMGVFEGVETSSKKIFVGNHRDAWCFGSADAGGGTAIMMEVITALDLLVQQGWRPLRSIYFASWDAEEYNIIGSTEYVEDHIEDIRDNAIAYLNVDVGVVGDKFRALGSPLFQHALSRVLGRVADPLKNRTVGDIWTEEGGQLGGLGAGSDYVAFQDLAGCSSIDIMFDGPENGYPYHSCYETFDWMDQFGDPGFIYHATLAEIWVLLILEIAQEPIYPFDLKDYGLAVKGYINDLEKYAIGKDATEGKKLDLTSLRKAADTLGQNAKEFEGWEDWWWGQFRGRAGYETNTMGMQRLSHNARMSNFETHLLDLPADGKEDKGGEDGEQHGIPGREQFKHVIFGPDAWSGYDEAYFPAVRDAIELGNWSLAQTQADKAARILSKAADKLLH